MDQPSSNPRARKASSDRIPHPAKPQRKPERVVLAEVEARGSWRAPVLALLQRQIPGYCGAMLVGSSSSLIGAVVQHLATHSPTGEVIDILLEQLLPFHANLMALAIVSHLLPFLWTRWVATALFGPIRLLRSIGLGMLTTLQVLLLAALFLEAPSLNPSLYQFALCGWAILGGAVAGGVYHHLSWEPQPETPKGIPLTIKRNPRSKTPGPDPERPSSRPAQNQVRSSTKATSPKPRHRTRSGPP